MKLVCPLCKKSEQVLTKHADKVNEHLIVLRTGKDFFVHGPIKKPGLIADMVQAICKEAGIETEIETS